MVRTRPPSPALGWLHPAPTDVGSLRVPLHMQCHLLTPASMQHWPFAAPCSFENEHDRIFPCGTRSLFIITALMSQIRTCSCTTAPHPGMLEMQCFLVEYRSLHCFLAQQ